MYMIIPPPRASFITSVKSGNFRIRAEISVHKPTATKSALAAPSTSGVTSKHATS